MNVKQSQTFVVITKIVLTPLVASPVNVEMATTTMPMVTVSSAVLLDTDAPRRTHAKVTFGTINFLLYSLVPY